jgi:serine/threonine protein kinase/Tfp pilus assembly protein PilF
MSPDTIFAQAIEIESAPERAAFLDRACRSDPELRRQLEKLVRDHFRAGAFLERPAAELVATAEESVVERPGTVVGPYKLLEQIGEGGFGVVFLAEQTQPVRRKVALKVLKPGMDTRQVVARFEAERQALALMDHPNIAKVFDGGATPSGRPYFVMELVKGVPITEFCDHNRLTPRQRLELFIPVCQAVQHAHQKGIIHRDLKPSNVLVSRHDSTPVPKVIDFGIAKALGQELTDKTVFTGFAQMIGTPLYMSPEQAGMSDLDVDTRGDVYSLGVLLYELLTGTTPFTRERFRQAGYDEIRRIIREEEPPKPSTRLSESKETLASISANRHTEPAKLTRLVRGELDWIVMKALEKDRDRRYESANGFAQDVQRYLADEPVLAGPPSAWYRFRKFARRNRAHLALAAALALLLLGAGAFAWHAERQAAERRVEAAARLGRDEEAVAALLDQCETALRADQADPAAIALEAAEQRAADGGAEDLAGRLTRCRADLGLLRELNDIDTLKNTWAGAADTFPDPNVVTARRGAALAAYGVTPDEGRTGEAAARVNGSVVRDRVLTALDLWLTDEPSPQVRAGVRAVLRAADPEPYRDEFRDALDAGDKDAVTALAERPEALRQPARFAVVFGLLDVVAAERRRALLESALRSRPGDLALLMAMGRLYEQDGRPEAMGEQVRWFQAAVAAHPRNVASRNNLGVALARRGDVDGAIACFQEAIGIDPTFARGHHNLADSLDRKGETEKAIASYLEAIRHNPNDDLAHNDLAGTLLDRMELDRAIHHLEKAIQINPNSSLALTNLGNAMLLKGKPDAGLSYLETAVRLGPHDGLAHYQLGNALLETDRARALTHYRKAIALLRKEIRPRQTYVFFYKRMGAALYAARDLDGAIDSFQEAIRLAPNDAGALNDLGVALRDRGKVDAAIPFFRRAIEANGTLMAPRLNLGIALMGKRDLAGGIEAFRGATELDKTSVDAHVLLGAALQEKGDAGEAIAAYRAAIRLGPNHSRAHNNLAWLLATGPDRVRDGKQAVEHAARACELTGWKDPVCLNALAAAHAEAGDFDRAVAFQKQALASGASEAPWSKAYRERLNLYERKMPYRDPKLVPVKD